MSIEQEIYEAKVHSLVARSSRDRIEVCKSSTSRGFGVRVVKDGAVGFSFCSKESQKKETFERAVKSASLAHKEGYSLPGKGDYGKVKQFDPKIKKLGEEDLVEMLLETMNGASEKAEPSKGEVSLSTALITITNSNGVEVEQKETLLSAFVSAKKKEAIGYDFIETKRLGANLKQLGRNAGEWAAMSAGGKPVHFTGPVILSVDTVASFFNSCVLRNLNGENARRGKSLWTLGAGVMPDSVSLLDDPSKPWAPGTASCDDEAVPATTKTLVENGVVTRFLYNTRSANLAGAESTGNGFRSGFTGVPSIGPTNVILSPKETTDVFDVKEGLFVNELMGFHNMNPVTGDFSLDIVQGFTVKNGEPDKPVKGCMLVGNFFKALKEPEFAREEEVRGNFFSPKMRFEGRVVSK